MFEHIYRFCPLSRTPSLEYVGSNLHFTRFAGPGRPEGGHLQPIPQVKVSPAPDPAALPAGAPSVVILDGPLDGVSRSGLTIYGQPRACNSWRLGKGFALFVEGPIRIVTMERPTGSRREAHLSDDHAADVEAMTGIPVMWRCGDALSATYLCGWPRVVSDLGAYRIEERWLPTRQERARAEDEGMCAPVLQVLRSMARHLNRKSVEWLALAEAPSIAPWDQEADDERLGNAVRAIGFSLAIGPDVGLDRYVGLLAEAVGAEAPAYVERTLPEGCLDDAREDRAGCLADLLQLGWQVYTSCQRTEQTGWAREEWEQWAERAERPRSETTTLTSECW